MSSQPSDPVIDLTRSILTEAAQRPWLAALLMRRRPDWLTRLTRLAQHIRHLPNHTRRVLRRKLASGLAAAALLLALASSPTAYAAAITVTGDGTGGTCSLANAVTSANTDTATGNCPAGSGADTINLNVDVSLTAALPNISSQITIEGHNHTIQRTGGGDFSVFVVGTGANLTINSAMITGGSSPFGGGMNVNASGTLTVNNSTISGNSVINSGGGIYSNGTVTVNNSTISGNTATWGGGLYVNSGTAAVRNSTISGNSATNFGGGIETYGPVTVQNSIVAGNTAPANVDCRINSGAGGSITSQGYNIESATECNFTGTGDQRNVSSGSLNLQPLANNGTSPHPDTRALGTGSVAIDRIPIGTNGCASTNTDERGAQRAGGGTHGGSACDVGAYEVSDQTPTAVTLRNLTATNDSSPSVVGLIGAGLLALFGVGRALLLKSRRRLRQA